MHTGPGQGGGGEGDLTVPALPATCVARPALVAALDSAAASRPVVVAGGPGWGKTTAVAGWVAGRDAGWVTLDGRDAAVPRLANRILRALRHRLPEPPLELVIASGPPVEGQNRVPVEAVIGAVSDLLSGLREEFVLVLDGLQVLPAGGEAARLVAGLAEHAPPALRLVVITEPATERPPRWPALERPGVVGPQRLAFSVDEVAAFLRAALGSAEPAAVTEVWELTSGWPAAVRLAAEALRSAGAAGNHVLPRTRTTGGQVLEELAAHVLAREPAPARRVLAAAAVLGRVDVPLCEALGHGQAAALLPALAGRGLLRPDGAGWSPVGPVRQLLTRTESADPAAVRDTRTRAAAYHADRGEHAAALQCLLAAGDRSGTNRLLIANGESMLAEGEVGVVLAAAGTLDLSGADSRLLAVLSHARQLAGDWLGALALLRATAGDGPLEPALALRLGQLHYMCGRPDEAVAAFERTRVVDAASTDEVQLLGHAAVWLRAAGEHDLARTTANRAAAAADRGGRLADQARSHWTLALIAADDGDRAAHDLHYRRGLRLAGKAGDRLIQIGLRINRASYLAEEGAPAEAVAEAEAALRVGRELGVVGYEPWCYNIRARASARLGRFAGALADVDASLRQWQDIGPSFDVAFGLVVRGDIHLRRGEPGQAEAALTEALRAADTAGMRPLQALTLAALARARAADDLASARKLAERAVEVATGTGRVPALLARGWVALLAGDRDGASQDAAEARSVAGARRDRAGLAEALELAVLAPPDPLAAAGLLDEAAALWTDLGDPVGQARVRLIAARLAGPAGASAADEAIGSLHRLGVRTDAGTADALAVPIPQPPIAVRALGTFQVLRNGVPIPTTMGGSKKARDLFKILITRRGRRVSREQLIDLIWPEDDRTGNNLSQLLTTVRTILDPERAMPEPGPILSDRDTVALNLDLVTVDVETFLDLAAEAQTADRHDDPDAPRLLATAAAAYTGDFLPEDSYADWAEPLRATVRSTRVAVLRALVRHITDLDQLEHHLLQLLDHDPYDEQTHRLLVRTLRSAGRHGEARSRYRAYLARMAEIGVTPDESGSDPPGQD
jgi:ATP/maltotriose-dependent transcriptional regulator MalT/DNA-binding SARP family transcriptional activator